MTTLLVLLALMGQSSPGSRTVTFHPMEQAEKPFIYRDLGSQEIAEERARFQDGGSYFVYRFAFRKGTPASVTLRLSAQYRVDLSADGERYETAAASRERRDAVLTFDLTPLVAASGFAYVRVGDAKPDDGWGGKIHEVTVRGDLLDQPAPRTANVPPTFLAERDGLYARLPRPARRIVHFAGKGISAEESILFRTLQGLVNRERNELVIGDTVGQLGEMWRRGWVDGVSEVASGDALMRRYPQRDAVVYDPALHGSENLAVMIGAMEGWVTAHPDLVKRYGLRVREDLRGRWTKTIEGYRAVYARYKGRFNRQTLVMAAPTKRPALYDYAVAHRAFTFWIVGGSDADAPGADRWAEEEWFESTLSRDFAVNIPILGYPQVEPSDGIGENRGVALFSRCAKFLVPADHMGNMSLLSAFPSARGMLRRAAPRLRKLDRSRVYASLVLSDGDNQCLWNGPGSFMFGYIQRMKETGARSFSVSYTMGPSIVDLNPLAALLTNDRLSPQDSIGGAVSGVGYMYMRHYADNFGADRPRVVAEYMKLTGEYLAHASERWNWIMDYGGPGSVRLQEYGALRGCVALMGGYGRETIDPTRTAERVGGAVAFHSVTRMTDVAGLISDVQLMLDRGKRPMFLHVFVGNWGVNADQYRELAGKLNALGVDVVTPEALADLYRQSAGDQRGGR